VLVRVETKELGQGALVAVVEAEARDHLGDRQAGAVAARLQTDEPVADTGQRGEQDAVGDLDVADAKWSCEGWLHLMKRLGGVALVDEA
jgi:hypothetical protein